MRKHDGAFGCSSIELVEHRTMTNLELTRTAMARGARHGKGAALLGTETRFRRRRVPGSFDGRLARHKALLHFTAGADL